MRMKSIYGCGVILGLALLAAEALATTYYVATNGLDSNNGQSWETPFLTISNAVKIAQTNAVNVVLVSNGTYLTVAQIVITNAITVRSWNNGAVDRTNTVVQRSGAANHRIFYISNTAAVVEGFTITNGNAPSVSYAGTGVWLDRGGTIINCLITGNTGGYNFAGSGVFINQTGTVDNCDIIGNSGYYAGAAYLLEGGVITNCQIFANTGMYAVVGSAGGGVMMRTGGLLVNSTCVSNYAAGGGGGVFILSNAVVRACDIQYNSGYQGGGVCIQYSGTAENCRIRYNVATATSDAVYSAGGLYMIGGTVRNCLIEGNSGTNGAGMFLYAGNALVQNCTIVSNIAQRRAGGIFMYSVSGGSRMVKNSIVYFNLCLSESSSNFYNAGSGTNGYDYTCVAPTNGLTGSNNIPFNPLFVDAPSGDSRLKRESPCVNAGLNQDWMIGVLDLDGHRRIDRFAGVVDMGCYEYVFPGTMFIMH